MTIPESSELQWLAFQYVSGELSAAAAAEFEQQLAGDQAACEAVAQAVLLTSTIHTACAASPTTCSRGAQTAPRSTSSPAPTAGGPRGSLGSGGILWSACAAAAVVVAVGIWGWQSRSPAEQPHVALADPAVAAPGTVGKNLVAIWSETGRYPSSLAGITGPADRDADFGGDDAAADLESDFPDTVRVPSWLIAAVAENRDSQSFPHDDELEDN